MGFSAPIHLFNVEIEQCIGLLFSCLSEVRQVTWWNMTTNFTQTQVNDMNSSTWGDVEAQRSKITE